MAGHNDVGRMGEELAKRHLEEKGYKIIERNYKTRWAEIDLVAEQKEGLFGKPKLVFVEVRTKIGERFGSPEDTLNRAKLQKVLWNSNTYAAFQRWQGASRIDAICIVLHPDLSVQRLTHHENIIN